ncbi:MAG: ribonuclease P protein component [Patescibacteria group bacterium]
MLPSAYRLSAEKEIDSAFKQGKISFSKLFTIKFKMTNRHEPRFCFIVGNKVSKKSSTRNLLKRRLRAMVWLNIAKIKPSQDIIIITKAGSGVLTKTYQELEQELLWLLKKAGLIISK